MKTINKIKPDDTVYIAFLDASNKFRKTHIGFSDVEAAVYWGKENLPNFNSDMLRSV